MKVSKSNNTDMKAKLITCCHKKQIFNPRTTQMQNNNKNKRKETKIEQAGESPSPPSQQQRL